jgi:hypothetical protein
MFETALQTIVTVQQEKVTVRFPRVQVIASQVKTALQAKTQAISTELEAAENKRQAKIEIKQKAQKLIQKGFSASVSDFQSWLYLPKLINCYQSELASALQQGTFSTWERGIFKQAIQEHQQAIVKWVHQACEFFDCPQPADLWISFPDAPQVLLPEQPKQATRSKQMSDVAPVAITSGLGWIFGGPVGAAVVGGATYLINQLTQDSDPTQPESSASHLEQAQEAYAKAAQDYLTRFSTQAFSTIRQYEEAAEKIINCQVTEEPVKRTPQHHQLQLFQSLLDNLNQELESVRARLSV